ncbi:MAG: leucyl/phenylalanyl-tRNA--protein transferase [Proteobacteria bacterium]|nr:leucyl/phenylalanyl-tRNA--protein transferase [Pseudomonadota bacterium]
MSSRQMSPLHPDIIEYAYRRGYFPMPHPETGEVLWFDPDPRTIIPLSQFHVSRSLKKSILRRGYTITFDTQFELTVNACAARPETWINSEFKLMYREMFQRGVAHSVEVWSGGELVGGVFGLKFGSVFNGESMFSTQTDASKIALFALVSAMKRAEMEILEVQFMTPHLASLGAQGISSLKYHEALASAVAKEVELTKDCFKGVLATR